MVGGKEGRGSNRRRDEGTEEWPEGETEGGKKGAAVRSVSQGQQVQTVVPTRPTETKAPSQPRAGPV